MQSDTKPEAKLPVQNLILLASAVLGTVLLYEGPLKSSRPVEELSNKTLEAVGDRRVQARLWQDPFDAVLRHVAVEQSDRKSTHGHSLEELAHEVTRTGASEITVLALLTDGAPYADPAESRLRQRYAVLAGLDRAGYQPVDGEHVRFFLWPSESRAETGDRIQHPTCRDREMPASLFRDWREARVPVEWYESKTSGTSQVVVFWIKDQDLGGCPLAALEGMRRIVSRAFRAPDTRMTFKVIGPRFSGTVASMVSEVLHTKPQWIPSEKAAQARDEPLEMYSPWSTAPEELLVKGVGEQRDVATILKDAGISFRRVVGTDDGLMDELIKELGGRGVDVGTPCQGNQPCDLVALVSEWDTLYGRALPEEFKNAVVRADTSAVEHVDRHIRRFSYLRGLDGELPKEKGNDGARSSSQGGDKLSPSPKERHQLAEQLERPEGRSQLDYVRRLVQVLKEEEADAQLACGIWKGTCPGFKAIGVLGSDVYDKLLILQALKQHFPHVIFFTTDLDARLFHPREMQWTRNLVIVSHYGLTLNKQLQQSIPPFRDTYQTSTFLAVIRAVGVLAPETSCSSENQHMASTSYAFRPLEGRILGCFDASWQPRIHEIGENGPVDLSHERVSSSSSHPIQSIHELRPKPPSVEEAQDAVAFVVMVLAGGWVLFIPASRTVYQATCIAYRTVLANPVLALVALALFGVLWWILWFAVIPTLVSDGEYGEPFSLFDGVSIWPSQLVRGAVIILGVVFIVRIHKRLGHACEEVERDFHNLLVHRVRIVREPVSTDSQMSKSRFMCVVQWCRGKRLWSVNNWALTEGAAETVDIWEDYRTRMNPLYVWGWVIGWSVIFFVSARIVMALCGYPGVPYRGPVALQVNQVIVFVAVSVLIIVIFLVLDLTRLTSVFVRKLVSTEMGCVSPTVCLHKLQLIARLTARIDVFVYYPAALLGLMVLARAHAIDNWNIPVGLAIVLGLGAAYVVASAILLRKSSEQARRQVIQELSARRLAGLQEASPEQVDHVMTVIGTLREGAFLPYTELPVFRAVALPSGLYGVTTVIEFIANSF